MLRTLTEIEGYFEGNPSAHPLDPNFDCRTLTSKFLNPSLSSPIKVFEARRMIEEGAGGE